MREFEAGDRVRIDIPDTSDPDYERLHGQIGKIEEILEDEAGEYSGDERDSYLFEVHTESGAIEHLRWRDLRSAESSSHNRL